MVALVTVGVVLLTHRWCTWNITGDLYTLSDLLVRILVLYTCIVYQNHGYPVYHVSNIYVAIV